VTGRAPAIVSRALALAVSAALLVLWTVLPAGTASAATLHAPGQKWRTSGTDHFVLHFPAELEPMARQLAPLLEAAHARQSLRMQWRPRWRTHVVLIDQFDAANGMATAIPYNLMVLFASPPDGDSGLMLNPDGWLETLSVHEYTHILHLDRATGLPAGLRDVFGRMPLFFPNMFNPGWMIEGLATREETLGSGYGRGRGALFSGVLRAQAAADRIPGVSKGSNPFSTWPDGMAPYLYGVHFLQYLNDTFGENTVDVLVREYSDNIIPWTVGWSMGGVLHESPGRSWDRWRAELHAEAMSATGTPGVERLTRSGHQTGGARVSPDGRHMAWTERTPRDHTRLMLAEMPDLPAGVEVAAGVPDADHAAETSVETPSEAAANAVKSHAPALSSARELTWRNGGRSLTFSPDGKILYFSQPEYTDSFRLYDDLYAAPVSGGKVKRLTRGLRLRDPDAAPDNTLVAVQNAAPQPGSTRLVRIRPGERSAPEVLFEPPSGTVLSNPRVQPGTGAVAVAAFPPEGGSNILLLPGNGAPPTRITRGPQHDADPAWSPDGRFLLFTSDRSGIFNLFAWDSLGGTLSRVTDEVGGALSPEITADGQLLFAGIGADGLDVYRMPFSPDSWVPVQVTDAATPPVPSFPATTRHMPTGERLQPAANTGMSPLRPYRAFPAGLPRFWWPVTYSARDNSYVGIFTAGADPLQRHTYSAELSLDTDNTLSKGYLMWQYDRFYPSVQFFARRDAALALRDPLGDVAAWIWADSVALDMAWPFRTVNRLAQVQIGVESEEIRVHTESTTYCRTFGCVVSVSPSLRYGRTLLAWDNTQKYGLGISRTDGRRLVGTHKQAMSALGSGLTGGLSRGSWDEYLPLGGSGQVLHVRALGGVASGDLGFHAGGVPPSVEDPFDADLPVRGVRYRSLRGTQLLAGTLEWRFPLGLPEIGPGTFPAFLEKLHGRLFTDSARLFDPVAGWRGVSGGGGELGLDTTLGFYLPVNLLLGYASGFGRGSEDQLYLRVELGF